MYTPVLLFSYPNIVQKQCTWYCMTNVWYCMKAWISRLHDRTQSRCTYLNMTNIYYIKIIKTLIWTVFYLPFLFLLNTNWKQTKVASELLSIHKPFRVSVCFYCMLFKYVYWLKQSWELLLFFSLVCTHIIYAKTKKKKEEKRSW